MSIKAIITNYKNKIMLACFENDKMISLSFYGGNEENIGTVYLCRIDKVLSNINGAFVKYSDNKTGFIKGDNLKVGNIVPLQLKKEGTSTKEPLFTDKISINSKYCVIASGSIGVFVSSKIKPEYNKEYVKAFSKYSNDFGVSIIIRTNAQFVSIETLQEDIINTIQIFNKIYENAKTRTIYSKLYTARPGYLEELNGIKMSLIDEIITDNENIYSELINNFDTEKVNLKLYSDELLSLFHLYKMEGNIKRATERTVLLKSGASIVIDTTEALTAIDVNTHYSASKGDKEQTFFETNKEAASEIIRQLRIRNISGMIIIDFINMKMKSHYDELFNYIKEISKNDPNGLKIIDITELKLFELVRTKKRRPLIEQMR